MKKRILKAAACALALLICAAFVVETGNLRLPGLLAVDSSQPSYFASGNVSAKYPFSKIKSRIKKYQETNPEVVGWLTIPGTDINYPVPLNTESNSYYLKRTWQGVDYPDIVYENYRQRPATATYLDYRTKLGESWKDGTSRNIVVYGHNWSNLRAPFDIGSNPKHTMFAQLQSYTDKKFLTEHPYVYFSTGQMEGIWKVFAVGYTEVKSTFAYNTPNLTKDDFTALIEEWKNRSMFDISTEVDSSDRIITMSTCTRAYDAGSNQRFVVVARLLRSDESEIDKVTVKTNTDVKQPNFKAKPPQTQTVASQAEPQSEPQE